MCVCMCQCMCVCLLIGVSVSALVCMCFYGCVRMCVWVHVPGGCMRGSPDGQKGISRVSRKKSTRGGVYIIYIYKISIVGQDRGVPALKTQNTALKTQNNNSKSYLKHKPNLDLDKCVGFVA